MCFNPRPPLLASEPLLLPATGGVGWVSIRARHCWRANPRLRRIMRVGNGQFQSAPAIAGERTRVGKGSAHHARIVSIRARHCWRANPSFGSGSHSSEKVSIRARHCWRANPNVIQTMDKVALVSIRARHCWRANPVGRAGLLLLVAEFQSAPAIAGERTRYQAVLSQGSTAVSIRARHCWRANPLALPLGLATSVSFNPRPPLLASEPLLGQGIGALDDLFQSAPAIAGERTRFPCKAKNLNRFSSHFRERGI